MVGWGVWLPPTFLFFVMSHFACQVLSSGAWSHVFCAVHLLALLCLCCLYLYLYLVYSLVADDVPRHLGFFDVCGRWSAAIPSATSYLSLFFWGRASPRFDLCCAKCWYLMSNVPYCSTHGLWTRSNDSLDETPVEWYRMYLVPLTICFWKCFFHHERNREEIGGRTQGWENF
jgi:hypothetical protein